MDLIGKFNELGARRSELRKELENCHGSIADRKKMLEEKKTKLDKFEYALVNSKQSQTQER